MPLGPSLLQQISLVLLLAVGLSLLLPLLGGPMPPIEAVLAVLALRLVLQICQWWPQRGTEQAWSGLASLMVSVLLLVLLVWQLTQPLGS